MFSVPLTLNTLRGSLAQSSALDLLPLCINGSSGFEGSIIKCIKCIPEMRLAARFSQ